MLISKYLHKKSSNTSIETRSTLASLLSKGQTTKHNCKMLNRWFSTEVIATMLVQRTKENEVFWQFDVTIQGPRSRRAGRALPQ